ncbi:MAG TPA: PIG-L deacetylase family protein [Stellaceae bacterium]|nr:PIG-L deacetylase family protein [Stellaceae bacterium]
MLSLAFGSGATPFRLLCLGAHADDIEIGCGGTLLRLKQERPDLEVRWIVFSGDTRRRHEAEAGANALLAGVKAVTIEVKGFRDGFFPAERIAIKESFEEIKHSFRPSLVLTHYREDLHQDHRLLSELTYNSFRDHLIWEYEVAKYDGDLGNPNFFVPLRPGEADAKIAMLIEHFPSQRDHRWFRPEVFRAMLALRGVGCNAPEGLAEAFYCRKAVV